MKEITKEGKTVESAISLILEELKCTKDELDIQVLQEPVKGIFGLAKMAKVRAIHHGAGESSNSGTELESLNEDQKHIKLTLEKVLTLMGIKFNDVKVIQEGEYLVYEIKSESEGLLIGHHGKTIESIQYLINKMVNQKDKEKVKFFIDIAGYLNKHKQNLNKIADIAVSKVIENKEETKLVPMNAYDRRLIHLYLKDNPLVKTQSEGEGSNRYVVISLK